MIGGASMNLNKKIDEADGLLRNGHFKQAVMELDSILEAGILQTIDRVSGFGLL